MANGMNGMMAPFEIDTDCEIEGSAADISLDEDRLIIETSLEASEYGGLQVVGWKEDADHESVELESPSSPDFYADDEYEEISQDDENSDDDSRDGDHNNNQENNKTEDKDEMEAITAEELNSDSEDSEAIRDDDRDYVSAELNQDDPSNDDDSNCEVIGYDDGYDKSEGMSGTEDRDDVDENSEEEEIEASTEEPMEIELNLDSSDNEESEKVERILNRFFKAARKKAKASPKRNDFRYGYLNFDVDASGESSATASLQEERLNDVDELLATKSSRIRKKGRKRTMADELLADAKFQHRSKRRCKEIVAEMQKYNLRTHRYPTRSKTKRKKQ
ncbi:Hypothetical predicted protein [Cloeon dipterum]|uniref:Uncharacterized protein n=1 Tax=Cloeon dipterum TaxID=197152 RepID=A0A8S1CTT3_9INSE|nr:Hypothetical predicted protein [Cloeon dipterum]